MRIRPSLRVGALLLIVLVSGVTAGAGMIWWRYERGVADAQIVQLLTRYWEHREQVARLALAPASQQLIPALALALCGQSNRDAAAQTVQDWAHHHEGMLFQLGSATGEIDYAVGLAWDVPALLSPQRIRAALTSGSGVHFAALAPGRYGWLQPGMLTCQHALPGGSGLPATGVPATVPAPQRFWVMARDAQADLDVLQKVLGGKLQLTNRSGTVLMSSASPVNTLAAQAAVPAETQPLSLRAAVAETHEGGRVFRRVTIPVPTAGRPVAMLVWRSDTTQQSAPARRLAWALVLLTASTLLIFAAVTLAGLRRLFAPMHRVVGVVGQLSSGRYRMTVEEEDSEREDEVGAIARGATLLRGELLNLQMLRDERQRGERQQGQLMLTHLRVLAHALDSDERDAMLAWMAQLRSSDLPYAAAQESAAQEGAAQESAVRKGAAPAGGAMSDLATVLGRLSTLVSAQHQRLRDLLQALSDAMEQEKHFAALRQELAIARRMQLSILPGKAPWLAKVDLHATIIPAREVGGDFYDYFMLDAGHLGVVIADVSGKGIPAAFFMAIARSLLKTTAALLSDPQDVVARVNTLLCADNPQLMFVTLFYGVLDVQSGVLRYVNAGHNPPVYCAPGQKPVYLPPGGNTALGVMPDLRYQAASLSLAQGATLVLYTDGVTEAQNDSGTLMGSTALLDTLAVDDLAVTPVAQCNDRIVAAIRAFEKGAPQADDITCLTVRFAGASDMTGLQ